MFFPQENSVFLLCRVKMALVMADLPVDSDILLLSLCRCPPFSNACCMKSSCRRWGEKENHRHRFHLPPNAFPLPFAQLIITPLTIQYVLIEAFRCKWEHCRLLCVLLTAVRPANQPPIIATNCYSPSRTHPDPCYLDYRRGGLRVCDGGIILQVYLFTVVTLDFDFFF